MQLLASILESLNAAVEVHNSAVREAGDLGELDDPKPWLLPPGCVTEDLVKAGPPRWSEPLRRAVAGVIVNEQPDEIVRMCDLSPVKTDTIKALRKGSWCAPGRKGGFLEGMPVGVHLMDLAHLIAHAGVSRAVLLG